LVCRPQEEETGGRGSSIASISMEHATRPCNHHLRAIATFWNPAMGALSLASFGAVSGGRQFSADSTQSVNFSQITHLWLRFADFAVVGGCGWVRLLDFAVVGRADWVRFVDLALAFVSPPTTRHHGAAGFVSSNSFPTIAECSDVRFRSVLHPSTRFLCLFAHPERHRHDPTSLIIETFAGFGISAQGIPEMV
jgi:hypothetical protein